MQGMDCRGPEQWGGEGGGKKSEREREINQEIKQSGLFITSYSALQNLQVFSTPYLCWSSFPNVPVAASNHLACHTSAQQILSQKGFTAHWIREEEDAFSLSIVIYGFTLSRGSLVSSKKNNHTHMPAFKARHLPKHPFGNISSVSLTPSSSLAWKVDMSHANRNAKEEVDASPDGFGLVTGRRETCLKTWPWHQQSSPGLVVQDSWSSWGWIPDVRWQECRAAVTQGKHGGSKNHRLPLGLQWHVQQTTHLEQEQWKRCTYQRVKASG